MKKIFLSVATSIFLANASFGQSAQELKNIYNDLSVFQDDLALKLKKGVTKTQLNKISDKSIREYALNTLAGNYDSAYKFATYKALLSPTILGQDLAIGDGYSKYENITGVYLPLGKHIIIVDGIQSNKDVKLIVPNWLRKAPDPKEPTKDPKGWGLEKQEFQLKNGVNVIDLKDFGSLAYINYFSDQPDKESEIKVHFLTGISNGYFDIKKHKDADWNKLIDNSSFPILDGLGKHIQIAYPKEALKKYAYNKGVELISNYDSLVYRQHRILGLIKYNKVPQNKILSRVNYNYYMFRDGDGVAYMGDSVGYAMGMVVDPARVIKGDPSWGFSHEVGHVHQTRPMFNWGGLGEVSNNLFSLYVTKSFGNKTRISEQKNYQSAKSAIIDKKISYLADPDVFNRLVPFWQLQLYFEGVGENPNFYPDLFEEFRKQNANNRPQRNRQRQNFSFERINQERNPAVHQINFIKTACDISKTDLTEFFDKYGFFFVGTLEYDDYGKYTYNMTQQMVDDCKSYISKQNYKKPKVDISTLED